MPVCVAVYVLGCLVVFVYLYVCTCVCECVYIYIYAYVCVCIYMPHLYIERERLLRKVEALKKVKLQRDYWVETC